ncbi:MAG: hypothetical protein PUF72_06950 [Clostridiales bacterium]|nr:hypothetical protein [Clostridiales bacterium]
MKLKGILSAAVAAMTAMSCTCAYGMSVATHDVTQELEVMKNTVSSSKTNWSADKNAKLGISLLDAAMKITPQNGGDFEVSAAAGGDLYEEVKSEHTVFWDFEDSSDVSTTLEPNKWCNMFDSNIISWTRPTQISVEEVEYYNSELSASSSGGTDPGVREPASEGSTKCVRSRTGKNDWHMGSLGMRIKLSDSDLQVGKSYTLSFYAMNSTASRPLYCQLTKPSAEVPNANDANAPWCPPSAKSFGNVKRYWSKFSVEIVPGADKFEDGYTVLWLGMAEQLERYEAIYFDNVTLTENTEEETQNSLDFSVKIKSQSPVTVKGILNGTQELFSVTNEGGGEYETVKTSFSVSPDDPFVSGETRGSTDAKDIGKFKIVFDGNETEAVLIKELSIKKQVEPERFNSLEKLAKRSITVKGNVYAPDDCSIWAVLSMINESGETVIGKTETEMTSGLNSVSVSGRIPNTADENSYLAIYYTDESGNIISERRQNIGKFCNNGENLVNGNRNIKSALDTFGPGQYLVEFTTAQDADTAQVRIGTAKGRAYINQGCGMCVITVTQSDIDGLGSQEVIEVGEIESADEITLKKVAD